VAGSCRTHFRVRVSKMSGRFERAGDRPGKMLTSLRVGSRDARRQRPGRAAGCAASPRRTKRIVVTVGEVMGGCKCFNGPRVRGSLSANARAMARRRRAVPRAGSGPDRQAAGRTPPSGDTGTRPGSAASPAGHGSATPVISDDSAVCLVFVCSCSKAPTRTAACHLRKMRGIRFRSPANDVVSGTQMS